MENKTRCKECIHGEIPVSPEVCENCLFSEKTIPERKEGKRLF